METLLGFAESPPDEIVEDKSYGQKLVPWISWEEWDFVRESLFSSSSDSIGLALRRILAWRSRGCIPVVIDVTASIIEIQQKDNFFRSDLTDDALQSEEMLAMLYCMAIMRFVNGVVEKMRKKTEVSIAEAADAVGIPRMLIDIRHEGSHRDLPSLQLVRLASIKALDWLKSYYWEPQKSAISFQNIKAVNVSNEIKSGLQELALCLKVGQITQLSKSSFEGKRSKKKRRKTLKNILRLYSSNSSEVVTVLLEFFLKILGSTDLMELSDSSQVSDHANRLQTTLVDWKHIIEKLSNKEPELLLTLVKVVLEMIEHEKASTYEREHLSSEAEFDQIRQLSYLCEWLIGILHKDSALEVEARASEVYPPKSTVIELLRKCLLVSSFSNNQLMASALVLARMLGESFLVKKLDKFFLLGLSNPDNNEENSSLVSPDNFLSQQEDSIRLAAEKLEICKLRRRKSNNLKRTDGDVGNTSRWVVTKSWNPCPIGMLPRAVGSSGLLPVLDGNDDPKEVPQSESKEPRKLNSCSGKREAHCAIELLDASNAKKIRENEDGYESNGEGNSSLEGVVGRLMTDGVWKKVREEEVMAIASGIRILV